MEYFLFVLFFAVGWILAKVDGTQIGKNKREETRELAAKAFQVGVRYGAEQTYAKMMAQQEEDNNEPKATSFGFDLTAMKKDI